MMSRHIIQAMEEWRKYRQHRSHKRAAAYARTPYSTFKNTRFYRTTRIFDGTTILFSFGISILVLIYTIYGYIFRLRHPVPGLEKPSVFTFIMLLLLGMTFFVISFIYLKAYQDTYKKRRRNHRLSGMIFEFKMLLTCDRTYYLTDTPFLKMIESMKNRP